MNMSTRPRDQLRFRMGAIRVNRHCRREALPRRWLANLACFGLLPGLASAAGQAVPVHPVPLRTITTAAEAHGLTDAQTALGYPVHLRGVVTSVDSSTVPGYSAMFVHDATGSIYVIVKDRLLGEIPWGAEVDVLGVAQAGMAAPVVVSTKTQVVGRANLPAHPPLADLFHLETGAADAEWVEVEGTIHSVREREHYVALRLFMMGGSIGVVMLKEPGADYSRLIDAKVRIRGNAAPMFNGNDQIVGARLMTPGLFAVKVLEPASGDPFNNPVMRIDDLLRWSQIATVRHRVHVRGQVTLQWRGLSLCLRDATRGICAQTVQDTQVDIGDIVDVVGFSEAVSGTPVLMDAVFKSEGHGGKMSVKTITAEQALLGKYDSELVAIDGKLIGSDLESSGNSLVLTSGNVIYTVIVPKSLAGSEATSWKIGSKLRITGICSVKLDVQSAAAGRGTAVAKSFQILMRSPQDVIVLQRQSWWTRGRALVALVLLFIAVVGAIGWIARLRRRVQMQTAALRKAREESAAINELAGAMREVTSQRKLTARVSATGSEPIAQLGIGFNRMLSELEGGALATRAAEAKLQHLVMTDELTGLPNRRALSESLARSLAAARREERILAVLFIDLDGFKAINDSLGHAAGDLLLVEVARRLKSRVRQADTLARLGGDEFTILLTMLHKPEEAQIVAASMLDVLVDKLVIEGGEATVGASIGISVFPRDGFDAETLLQHADSAMYVAKAKGKNQVHCFTPESLSSISEGLSLEGQLRGAIDRGELHLEYQPEFELGSYRLTRFEALLRWTHPVLGPVPPGKFIPIAEASGQIVAIGAYVLRQACIEALKWQDISAYPVQVAVNVSSLQFRRATFVDEVAATLRETGLRPDLLQLELTESAMLIGQERAIDTMTRLRALGVSLAIDDFGTGYSCLSYLRSLPFDMMKIDKSFVGKLASDLEAKAIVTFLIALAHSLKMQVVMEGVETTEQLEILQEMNGTDIQGFLLGRPMANPQSLLRIEGEPLHLDFDWSESELAEISQRVETIM
jgi:diguanylate cyclase (GGDEF)-like protein